MAHHIYNTRGLVLESTNVGEANKMYTLFTADVGVVRASAQGVRLQKSKLRYSLQDFSFSNLSLVRGKEVWRITSATIEKNIYTDFKERHDIVIVVARIFTLLKRLIVGEEINKVLFDVVHNAIDFLYIHSLTPQQVELFERIAVLRILSNLGYMAPQRGLADFLGKEWTIDILERFIPHQKIALEEINHALSASQL